jgi:hypothetical protein
MSPPTRARPACFDLTACHYRFQTARTGARSPSIPSRPDDSETDTLTGASGRDLFYQGLGDNLTDVKINGSDVETVL